MSKMKYVVRRYYTSYIEVTVETDKPTPINKVKEDADLIIDEMSDEDYKNQLFDNRECGEVDVLPVKAIEEGLHRFQMSFSHAHDAWLVVYAHDMNEAKEKFEKGEFVIEND